MEQSFVLYEQIEEYAKVNGLDNTLRALPVTKELLSGVIRRSYDFDKEGALKLTYYDHCLSATALLIGLKVPVSKEEEDVLLAATLCHDMIEHVSFENNGKELVDVYGLDQRVYDIVERNTRRHLIGAVDKSNYYQRVLKDKLAVLVALADRGNLVENLYGLATTEAINYVQDIRKYCLPMCVYAKEYYPDIVQPLNILMEKIRCLIDVTDIISSRYQKREMAYTNEILSLMEENSRIRGLIKQLESNQK